MKNKLISYPKTVAFLCGWLAVAALPPFFVWPVLLICVSVLLWLINKSNSAKKSFGLGYSFGFAFSSWNRTYSCLRKRSGRSYCLRSYVSFGYLSLLI